VHYSGNSNETVFYFGDFVRVVNSTGVYDTVYYKTGTSLVAERKNDSTMIFYHPDHLGSTSLITNSTGGKVEETLYQPYGAVYSGNTKSRFGYNNKEVDSTNLMYYGARYYNPTLGVFTQPDTIQQNIYDPQLLNKYLYTRANPYKYIDPSGHVVTKFNVVQTHSWEKGEDGKYHSKFTGYKIEYEISVDNKKSSHSKRVSKSDFNDMNSKAVKQSTTEWSGYSKDWGGYNMYQEYMVKELESIEGREYEQRHWSQKVVQNEWAQGGVEIALAAGAVALTENPEVGVAVFASIQTGIEFNNLEQKKADTGKLGTGDYIMAGASVGVSSFGSNGVEIIGSKITGKTMESGVQSLIVYNMASSSIWNIITPDTK
jgi:RHS repeat-associated protein